MNLRYLKSFGIMTVSSWHFLTLLLLLKHSLHHFDVGAYTYFVMYCMKVLNVNWFKIMLFLAQRIKYFDCENNKMDNKENLICNWMLWHSDDDFESIRVWEHSLLLLWLHLEVTKKKKKKKQAGRKTVEKRQDWRTWHLQRVKKALQRIVFLSVKNYCLTADHKLQGKNLYIFR